MTDISAFPTLPSANDSELISDGGLGGQVAEVLAEEGLTTRLIRLGTQDTFTESGNSRQLKEKYGISATALFEALR